MQSRPNKYLILIGGFVLLFACGKTPRGVLSEKKMEAVVKDMLIAEAMIGVDPRAYIDSGQKEALYESVFRKHKTTQEIYDSSLVWYGKNLNTYLDIYNRVWSDLDKQLKDLGDVQATSTTTTKSDSVDIWPRRPYLAFSPEALFNGATFDIRPPRGTFPSGSAFVLGMRLWGINPNMTQFPEVRITVEHADTTLTINEVIRQDGYHETRLQSLAAKPVRRVYGYIRMDNSDRKNYFRIYGDSINLMRYNYRSDFTINTDSIK